MSDSSRQSPTPPPDGEATTGGWQTPQSGAAWRTAEPAPTPQGWSVRALPEEVPSDAPAGGGWHLPSPEDTPFNPDDEIVIRPPDAPAPEDADSLFDLAANADLEPRETAVRGGSPGAAGVGAPEDALFSLASSATREREASNPSAPVAPEDIFSMLDLVEDDETEDTAFKSELFALTSMAQAEADNVEVVRGSAAPNLAPVAPAPEPAPSADDSAQLSTVERAFRQAQAGGEAAIDPGEYARRQLEQLEVDEGALGVTGGTPIPLTGASPAAGAADPGEYARRQLEQLGDTPVPSSTAAMPTLDFGAATGLGAAPAASRLDPRLEQLAQRFRNVEQQASQLRIMRDTGQLSPADFEAQLRALMIQDDDQVYWSVGAEGNTWYKYANNEWVVAVPPALQYANPAGASGTLPLGDSMLYSEDLPLTAARSAGYGSVGSYDDPLTPRQDVPINDPNLTQVGTGFIDDYRTMGMGASATMPSDPALAEPTVATPVGYGSSYTPLIEEPEEDDSPPELSGATDTPLYREALERRQRSTAQVAVLGLITVLGVLFLLGAGGVFLALNWYNGIVQRYEAQIAALSTYTPVFQTVRILDYQGNLLTTLGEDGNDRTPVDLADISTFAIHAVVANENPTFFDDPGWTFTDTVGGFLQSLTGGGGATTTQPTITQRVVSELVLRNTPGLQLTDLEFAVVAGEITNRYSKEQILSLFMNEFSFGNQNFGIEAAAQFYYQKSASDLTIPEAALLAAIVRDPSAVNPVTGRDAAFQAIRPVHDRMVALGCLNIPGRAQTCVERSDISATQIALVERRAFSPRQTRVPYPHFVNLVRAQLETYIPDLYSGGYVVRTTLVPAVHDALEERLNTYIENSGVEQFGVTTGAIMWSDPRGAIRAYVASPDFYDEQLLGSTDYLRAFRSPGQTIFPVIYAAALLGFDSNANQSIEFSEYATPATILWDVPSTLPTITGDYRPVNQYQQNVTYGPVTVRRALVNTYNIAAAKAYTLVGDEAVNRMAAAMGLRLPEQRPLDVRAVNGDAAVRVNDLLSVYGTIANGGQHINVYAIDSITKGGQPFPLPEGLARQPEEVLPANIAFLMQNMMTDDAARDRSIFPANSTLVIPGQPTQGAVAAVAGTGIGNADLLTVGFTSDAVVGVWLGRHDGGQIQRVNGFNAASPLWQQAMDFVLRSTPGEPQQFRQAGNISTLAVCPDTGIREGGTCTKPSRQEFFAANRQPPTPDQGFVVQQTVNTWTNQIATDNCPNLEERETRNFINIPDPFAIAWLGQNPGVAQSMGLPSTLEALPTSACDTNTTTPLATITQPTNGTEINTGETQVFGQVSAPDKFNRYELRIAPLGQTNFRTLPGFPISVQQPNPNSPLGTWDTRGLPNGQYQLRLVVTATDGGFVNRTVTVTVNNPIPTPTPTFTPSPIPPTSFPTIEPGFTPLPFDTPTFDPN